MRYKDNKGFTLIELLIVIALIGVLAVALLSTINPLEQTRKAKDAGRKAAAAELLNSVERFHSTFFCYPQDYTKGTGCSSSVTQGTINILGLEDNLVTNSQEMKPEFFDRDVVKDAGDHALIMTVDSDDLVHICFAPESQTFLSQAKKDSTGGTGTTHICVPE